MAQVSFGGYQTPCSGRVRISPNDPQILRMGAPLPITYYAAQDQDQTLRRGGLRQPVPAPLVSSIIALTVAATNRIPREFAHLIEYRQSFQELLLGILQSTDAYRGVRAMMQRLHQALIAYIELEATSSAPTHIRYRLKHPQCNSYWTFPIVKLYVHELLRTEQPGVYDVRLLVTFEDPSFTREAQLWIGLENPAAKSGTAMLSFGGMDDIWEPRPRQQRCVLQ
ncbi:hypothetical protein SCHPADRAFT_999862 [Schizopora paradoxa]|uniref:Uncharacterized protein n=1 Tax=Schizopora paradoxa TaxID=27342 RepID=A0A0H2REN2_9AGAM|nr:hypothetical protein SCHPADRAFT_999862 [Schizopora paradoxa]